MTWTVSRLKGGIEAAYKRRIAETVDPRALSDDAMAWIESVCGPIRLLSRFQMEEEVDPCDTAWLECEWLETAWLLVTMRERPKPQALQFRLRDC